MAEITKAFTLRRLSAGQTVSLYRTVAAEDGTACALLQAATEGGTPSPDWSVEGVRPIVTYVARTGTGTEADIQSLAATLDGDAVTFGAAGADGWQEEDATPPRLALKLEDGRAMLMLRANFADGTARTVRLGVTATGYSGSRPFTLEAGDDIICVAAAEGAYWIQVAADTATLGFADGETEQATATLTALCGQGTGDVPAGCTVDWYLSGVEWATGQDPAAQQVLTRDDVDSCEIVSAVLRDPDGTEVARDGLAVYDMADEWRVAYRASGTDSVKPGGEAVFTPYLLRNLQEVGTPSGAVFTHELWNAAGQLVRTASGGTVTVKEEDCAYALSGGTAYGDVELRGTCEW